VAVPTPAITEGYPDEETCMATTWPSFTPAAVAAASACWRASATARAIASSRICEELPRIVAWPVTVIPPSGAVGQHHTGMPQANVAARAPSLAGQTTVAVPEDRGWAPDLAANAATDNPARIAATTRPNAIRTLLLVMVASC
jgi:hypothetical protein